MSNWDPWEDPLPVTRQEDMVFQRDSFLLGSNELTTAHYLMRREDTFSPPRDPTMVRVITSVAEVVGVPTSRDCNISHPDVAAGPSRPDPLSEHDPWAWDGPSLQTLRGTHPELPQSTASASSGIILSGDAAADSGHAVGDFAGSTDGMQNNTKGIKRSKKPSKDRLHIKVQAQLSRSPWLSWGLQPAQLRLPAAHRYKHLGPRDLRHILSKFPGKWRDHGVTCAPALLQHMFNCDSAIGKFAPDHEEGHARDIFNQWLKERHMSNMRQVDDVTSNIQQLLSTTILPGLSWADIQGKPSLVESHHGEKWHLYLTDFRLDTFSAGIKMLASQYGYRTDGSIRKPSNIWMRYHGLSMYGLSTVLGTNFLLPSEEKIKGMETACGRGIYTTISWDKAVGYAAPHVFSTSGLLFRAVALIIIPGDSSVGGAADWVKSDGKKWVQKSSGQWAKEEKWRLFPRRPICPTSLDNQLGDFAGLDLEAPSESTLDELAKRKVVNRDPTRGEMPWTNVMEDGYEEQSSVGHLAGVFISFQTAFSFRRTVTPSRKSLGFVNWISELEPPLARPWGWHEVSPNFGGCPSAHVSASAAQSSS